MLIVFPPLCKMLPNGLELSCRGTPIRLAFPAPQPASSQANRAASPVRSIELLGRIQHSEYPDRCHALLVMGNTNRQTRLSLRPGIEVNHHMKVKCERLSRIYTLASSGIERF
jgi:hypothetical protein